jgi:DNA-binding NarL/FixJ family response regulator
MAKIDIGVRPARSSLTSEDGVMLVAGPGVREEIAEIVEREALTCEVFDDAQGVLGCTHESSPSLIVLWIEDTSSGLPGAIQPLTQRFPEAALIVVCSGIERWGVRGALAAGAAAVVLTRDLDSALGPCLHAVHAGQACVPRGHWRQVEPPALSSREKQILGLVVMGFSNNQIAEQLFLAESTVKSHLSSAFSKLGVRSRNEATNLILDPDRGLGGVGILALGGEAV